MIILIVGEYTLLTVRPVSKNIRIPAGPPPQRYADVAFATQAEPFHAAPPAMNRFPSFADTKYPPASVSVEAICICELEDPGLRRSNGYSGEVVPIPTLPERGKTFVSAPTGFARESSPSANAAEAAAGITTSLRRSCLRVSSFKSKVNQD